MWSMSPREKDSSFFIESDTRKQNQTTKKDRKCPKSKEWGAALNPAAVTVGHKALNFDADDQGQSAWTT